MWSKRMTDRLRLGERRVRGSDMRDNEEMRQNHENADVDANASNAYANNGANDGGGGGGDDVDDDDDNGSSSDGFTLSSHNDTDGSESEDDGADLDLHPGLLAFLSRQQSSVDHELSAVADRLRGENNGRHMFPLLRINLVRKFMYDDGVIQIARAMEEGCYGCPHHYSLSLDTHEQKGVHSRKSESVGASFAFPAIGPPCQCPSRNLTELVLSRCHIGDDGACALAHALSKSCTPSLEILDLSSNNITGVAVTCLANCLVTGDMGCCGGYGASIETLVLSSNPILSIGANALASALRGCRSGCMLQQEDLSDDARDGASGSAVIGTARGFCSLKKMHLSGCQLNDEDAIVLGSSLLPCLSHSEPTIFTDNATNNLTLLNLHGNRITIKGMEFLCSVIHNSSPESSKSEADGDSGIDCLQSLYFQSNHTVELGVIANYGTRDYNYGHFFDQEEDEQLLVDLRNYEMIGTEPSMELESLKAIMMEKWILKEKMMHSLSINRLCVSTLEDIPVSPHNESNIDLPDLQTTKEKRQQILCEAARKKIAHLLEEMLRPSPIVMPQRQDEYGKYIDDSNLLGTCQCIGPKIPTIGKHFTSMDSNVFPHTLSWINHHFCDPMALAMVFDILRESPDVCGFHSLTLGKAPSDK